MRRFAIFLVLFTLIGGTFRCTAQPETSPQPLAAMLKNAPDDTSRFWILHQAHTQALATHETLSYQGIDTIRLAIPQNAPSIPIGDNNDFHHVVILVTNNAHGMFLFSHICPLEEIHVPDIQTLNRAIDSGNYAHTPLADDSWLIEITDSTPWIGQRAGHAYGHFRKELFLLHDGRSVQRPAMPFSGSTSVPHLRGRRLNGDTSFVFQNITLVRDSSSTCRTYLLDAENICHAILRDISVLTPPNNFVEDCAIKVYNCADLLLDSLSILGSYSRHDHSGYGILLDNIHLTHVRRLYARTPWGVFGTNNLHTTLIEDSDFDRFDIHCYGRDVTFLRCRQQDSYNQFSSLHGTLFFDSCTFSNFTPVLIEDSYNAYPHFQILMRNCTWSLTPERHVFLSAGQLNNLPAIRPELSEKCLPDIRLINLTILSPSGLRPILIHYGGRPNRQPIHGLSEIFISHTATPANLSFILSDQHLQLLNPANIVILNHSSNTLLEKKISHF